MFVVSIVGWVEVTKPNKPKDWVLGFAIGKPNLQLPAVTIF